MERDKNKILIVVNENGNTNEVNDLEYFFHLLRTTNITTIVIGETNINGVAIWEKQFAEATVMPSGFGEENK